MPISRLIAAAACAAVLLAAAARAETVEIPASRDATLVETDEGDLANGSGEHLFSGNTGQGAGGNTRRALLAFDVATAIPPGATITSVTLRLYMSRSVDDAARIHSLHRVTTPWSEGPSDPVANEGPGADAMFGDCTWLYTAYDILDPAASPAWQTPGGDLDPAPSAGTLVGGIGFYTWGSTPGLVADVQGWLDDPASNEGWLLIGEETGNRTVRRFSSRELVEVATQRPRLTVEFTVGVPTGGCCLPAGSCAVVTSEADCLALGGTFEGLGAPCVPTPCPQPTGACCFPGEVCLDVTLADCVAQGGAYQGDGVPCAADPCPLLLTPFVDRLSVPFSAKPDAGLPGGEATYTISLVEIPWQMHGELPPTTVWAYGGAIPGPTIEARRGAPVAINWFSNLRYSSGPNQGVLRVDHLLPVDPCPRGAEDGAPRTVARVHGAHAPAGDDGAPGATILPGEVQTFVYPNDQPGGTLWYGDGARGLERLNAWAGLAGFYLLRDDAELGLNLPAGQYEIPLLIQDRSFDDAGQLVYPADWEAQRFGEFIVVNGTVWPFLDVRRGAYRFRLLNGSNARTYELSLSNGEPFDLLGTDGGLLPFRLTVPSITLAPGERADIAIDFSIYPAGTEIVLVNSNLPTDPSAAVIDDVMQFVVGAELGFTDPLPADLRVNEVLQEADATATRDFLLGPAPDTAPDCAIAWWLIDDAAGDEPVAVVEQGATEIWRLVNTSPIAQPMHLRGVSFQVLTSQGVEIAPDGSVTPTGVLLGANEWELGWKDTVRVRASSATRVIARFDAPPGVYHLESQTAERADHEMRRRYQVLPACPADTDRSGAVETTDLLAVLGGWGPCPEPCSELGEIASPDTCPADVDRDCTVGVADLLLVLGAWGGCDG